MQIVKGCKFVEQLPLLVLMNILILYLELQLLILKRCEVKKTGFHFIWVHRILIIDSVYSNELLTRAFRFSNEFWFFPHYEHQIDIFSLSRRASEKFDKRDRPTRCILSGRENAFVSGMLNNAKFRVLWWQWSVWPHFILSDNLTHWEPKYFRNIEYILECSTNNNSKCKHTFFYIRYNERILIWILNSTKCSWSAKCLSEFHTDEKLPQGTEMHIGTTGRNAF